MTDNLFFVATSPATDQSCVVPFYLTGESLASHHPVQR